MGIHIIISCTRKVIDTLTLPCFCNIFSSMPLTLESPTIVQVPDGQWNSLLVSAASFMFSSLACGSLNYFVFLLFLVFSEDGDLQPMFRRYSWCFSSLIIFSWSSMLIFEILTIESSELLILHVDSLSLVSWVTWKSHVSPTILQLLTDIVIKNFLNYFIFSGNFWLEKLNFSFKISY